MVKSVEIKDDKYSPRDDKLSSVLKIEVVDHHGKKVCVSAALSIRQSVIYVPYSYL